MPKVNVYLPDDLADAVRESGIPVSAVCQRALEEAVGRVTAIRAAVIGDMTEAGLAARLPHFTARSRSVILLAAGQAKADQSSTVHSGHLLWGLLEEGGNMAMGVLNTMNADLDGLRADLATRAAADPAAAAENLHFGGDAANALELAFAEATAFRHNYIGCEHVLLGLVAEPDGRAGQILRARGIEPKPTRRAVTAALDIYVHGRAHGTNASDLGLAEMVRTALAPIVERLDRLEARLG
jgi:ATP-dependent Clp protease ATP-binding subunit ClpC